MVKLVTVATHSESYFPWLQESCKLYNTHLEILGWGEKWQGYTWKFTLMLNYLKTVDPEELVCFIDGHDVLLLRPLNEIQAYYENINKISNKKIIIGIDLFDSKLFKKMATIYFSSCNNFNINSGIYIGKAKDLLEIISKAKGSSANNADDQVILTEYCITNSDIFYIDIDSIFILNFNNTDEIGKNPNIKIEVQNNNYSLSYKNAKPFFVHGPGNTEMFELLKKLNYKITDEQIAEIRSKTKNIYFNKSIYYLKEMFTTYYIIIVIIILIIFLYSSRKK
jgi:hypothetical protein